MLTSYCIFLVLVIIVEERNHVDHVLEETGRDILAIIPLLKRRNLVLAIFSVDFVQNICQQEGKEKLSRT